MVEPIFVAKGDRDLHLLPKLANRHGLVAGATGTGKTVTLQRLAEGFSRLGVPVFLADIKGDLSGLCKAGTPAKTAVAERIKQMGIADFVYEGCPVVFWDVFGEQGLPVRATVTEMGPLLLSRLLDLSDVQAGVLTITFRYSKDNGLLLLDLKDLRAMLQYVSEHAKEMAADYGNVAAASVGAIQRGLLRIEEQGGNQFFGEPALELEDFIQTGPNGRGVINILAADKLMQSPQLYATFLLWMLEELFKSLPEVGDLEKPKMVFFFDEAHLLFNDTPKPLLEKIEQVVRLIRSKAVGVYFVTQNPLDLPDTVLAQLGNRVQHALRAFTPRDQKAVAAAAQTFRQNSKLKLDEVITTMAVGEALVSFLDAKGTPEIVERALVVPPGAQIGPITPEERTQIVKSSSLFAKYKDLMDRESAYEVLKGKAAPDKNAKDDEETTKKRAEFEKKRKELDDTPEKEKKTAGRRSDSVFMTFMKSIARGLASAFVAIIKSGVIDSIFGTKKKK